MKKNLFALLIAFVLFWGFVYLGTRVVPPDAGMIFVMALLFVLNPIYFILIGIAAGKNPAKSWFVPILAVVIFASAYVIILDMKEWIYSMVYLLLSYAAIGITRVSRVTP